jgi:hypothetical protein
MCSCPLSMYMCSHAHIHTQTVYSFLFLSMLTNTTDVSKCMYPEEVSLFARRGFACTSIYTNKRANFVEDEAAHSTMDECLQQILEPNRILSRAPSFSHGLFRTPRELHFSTLAVAPVMMTRLCTLCGCRRRRLCCDSCWDTTAE